MTDVRLDEFDKEEWREVARLLCPDMTDEEYEQMWQEFIQQKYMRTLH